MTNLTVSVEGKRHIAELNPHDVLAVMHTVTLLENGEHERAMVDAELRLSAPCWIVAEVAEA